MRSSGWMNSCIISGNPTQSGTFPVKAVITNTRTRRTASKTLDLNVKVAGPTPTPSNNAPIISTNSLPYGQIGIGYSTNIIGYDQDSQDQITITARDLPQGLSISGCEGFLGIPEQTLPNRISCSLTGTPTQSGYFNSLFTITDNRGGFSQRTIPIFINEQKSITPTPTTPPPRP